jgi:hypothetical protein
VTGVTDVFLPAIVWERKFNHGFKNEHKHATAMIATIAITD